MSEANAISIEEGLEPLAVRRHRAGWLSQLVVWISQPNSARHAIRVRWRDGEPRCCSAKRLGRWGDKAAPVLVGGNFREVVPAYRQCGRCWAIHSPPVRITRLE